MNKNNTNILDKNKQHIYRNKNTWCFCSSKEMETDAFQIIYHLQYSEDYFNPKIVASFNDQLLINII